MNNNKVLYLQTFSFFFNRMQSSQDVGRLRQRRYLPISFKPSIQSFVSNLCVIFICLLGVYASFCLVSVRLSPRPSLQSIEFSDAKHNTTSFGQFNQINCQIRKWLVRNPSIVHNRRQTSDITPLWVLFLFLSHSWAFLSSNDEIRLPLQVPLLSNSRYPLLHFRTEQVFPRYLAEFQSITNITTCVLWTFISENLAPPLIFYVPILR